MDKIFILMRNNCISVSFLIIAVVAARVLLQKAPKSVQCFLWGIVGLKLLIPFQAQSVFSLVPSEQKIQQNITMIQTYTYNRAIGRFQPTEAAENVTRNVANVARGNQGLSVSSILCLIWIIGMVSMLTFSAISYLRLKRKVLFAVPNMIGNDKIYQCDEIDTPFLLGFIKPRIYMPMNVKQEHISYVVAHELAHVKRKDYLVKPFGFLLLGVYWFHPLVWVAYLLFSKDIELACDEYVIRSKGEASKGAYSQALLYCSVNRYSIAACPIGFGEVAVKTRIKNILKYRKPAFWMMAGAVIICGVVAVCFTTTQKSGSQVVNAQQITDAANEVAQQMTEEVNEIAEQNADVEQSIDEDQSVSISNIVDGEGIAANSAEEFAQGWAQAFATRDGELIVKMSNAQVQKEFVEENLLFIEDDYVSFGWSSPWPMGSESDDGYSVVKVNDNTAEMVYYSCVSDPHAYIWRENITFENNDGMYLVTGDVISIFDSISDMDTYRKAYPDGVITGTWMDYQKNGFGEALNQNAKEQKDEPYYSALFTPQTAAVYLLNLAEDTQVSVTEMSNGNALVAISFAGSKGEEVIMMTQPYGKDGIWIPKNVEG